MDPVELKVARIGNSRGVRLPAATLERYRIGDVVIMEERRDGILLRPVGMPGVRLSWEETAVRMAADDEDWGEWDTTAADGLNGTDWDRNEKRVAEPSRRYSGKRKPRK